MGINEISLDFLNNFVRPNLGDIISMKIGEFLLLGGGGTINPFVDRSDYIDFKNLRFALEYDTYVVKDGNQTLYVGISRKKSYPRQRYYLGAFGRMWIHIQSSFRKNPPSQIGVFIKDTFPSSLYYDLFFIPSDFWQINDEAETIQEFESELYKLHNPLLGNEYGFTDSPIPEKYNLMMERNSVDSFQTMVDIAFTKFVDD